MDKKDVYSMWEDSIGVAPTNSASGGAIAGLPPDEPPIRKKKKYDGRRKDVREFVAKLLKRRQKREEKKFKNQTKSLEEELQALQESGGKVIDQLKKIAMAGGTGTVQFDDGSKQPVEPSEAGKIVNLYKLFLKTNILKI